MTMTLQSTTSLKNTSPGQFMHNLLPGILSGILTLGALLLPAQPVMGSEAEKLVVLPFEIVDNTPTPGSVKRNDEMLDKMRKWVADEIRSRGIYQVVAQNRVDDAVNTARLGTYIHTCNRCEFDIAREVGGDKVMIGWIYKMSLLILTLHIEIKDVPNGKTIISKAYDFRGDNEKAWLRAAKYMVRDLEAMSAR
jgi:hypothetical protein